MTIILIVNIGAHNFSRGHIVTDIIMTKIKAQGNATIAKSFNTRAIININSVVASPGYSNAVAALAIGSNIGL